MKQSISQLFGMFFAVPKANRQIKRLKEKGCPVKNVLSMIQNDNDTNSIVYTSPEFQPCFETFSDKYTFVGPSIRELEHIPRRPEQTTVYISMGTVLNSIQALGNSEYYVVMSVGEETDLGTLGVIPENVTVSQSVNQIEVLHQAGKGTGGWSISVG